MGKEVIITGFSNVTNKGVTLHTNIPAKLKTGHLKSETKWVSWDKIGESIFDDYTKRTEVQDMKDLRNS